MSDLANLGNKEAGELILAKHWNEMVAAIIGAVDDVQSQLNTVVDTRLAPLENTVAGLFTDVQGLKAFRTTAEALLGNYYRLNLKTTSQNFLVGQLATVDATVTNLSGSPVSNVWVDFITTWGRLRAVGSSGIQVSTGERALSVKTDAAGKCQVRLSASFSDEIEENDEERFELLLDTKVNATSPDTYQYLIMSATTPADPGVQVAFKSLNKLYQQPGTSVVQKYTDKYYLGSQGTVLKPGFPGYQDFKLYPVTVMAVVKKDLDPTTPDYGRGFSSIQVIFKEWLGSWYGQYLEIDDDMLHAEAANLRDLIDDDIFTTEAKWQEYYKEKVEYGGFLGRQRERILFYEAVEAVHVNPPVGGPGFINELVENTKHTVLFQQTLEAAQAITPYSNEQMGDLQRAAGLPAASGGVPSGLMGQLDGIAQKNTQLEATIGRLPGEILSLSQKITVLEQGSLELNKAFSTLNNQLASALNGLSTDIKTVDAKIATLEQGALELSKSMTALDHELATALGGLPVDIQSVGSKVETLEKGALTLSESLTSLQSELQGLSGQLQGLSAIQADVTGLKTQATQLSKDIESQRTLIKKTQNEVGTLSGRVETAVAETAKIEEVLVTVNKLSTRVEALKSTEAKLTEVTTNVSDLLNRVSRLETIP